MLCVLACCVVVLGGGVTAVGYGDSQYSEDLVILASSLHASYLKITALEDFINQLSDRVDDCTAAMSDYDNDLDDIEGDLDGATVGIKLTNDPQLATLLEDVAGAESVVHKMLTLARRNSDVLRVYHQRLDAVTQHNKEFTGRILASEKFRDLTDDKINGYVNELDAVFVQREADLNTGRADDVENLLNARNCYTETLTVNVTDGEGSVTVSFPSGTFVTGSFPDFDYHPVPYCAILGVTSDVFETSHGVSTSSLQTTGLHVDCNRNTNPGQMVVHVVDKSLSSLEENAVHAVEVFVSACTFTAQGLFSDQD